VSTLDPAHVDRVLRELQAAEQKRQTVDPLLPTRLMMDRIAVDDFFRRIEHESGHNVDLIGAGIGAVVGMLTAD
jgi:hypothetical protein